MLAAPAALGASGGPSSGPPPPAEPAQATLKECHPAPDQASRFATFQGEMTAIPGSQRMAIRVDLLERMPDGVQHHLSGPGLGVWRRSGPGVQDFQYVKQITNLPAPAAFHAIVRFRWLGARTRVLRRAQRATPACVQPEQRPKLVVGDVTARGVGPGSADAVYHVPVRNVGRGTAPPFNVLLTVNAGPLPELAVLGLAPLSRTVLDATGPRCTPGSTITVTLDPAHQVDEAAGGGAPVTLACPL